MRPSEIEDWAQNVIERVESGHPNEDSRVELKAQWPEDAGKAARQIAGHANAARGELILWLIGVDQKQGIVGANHEELANWWPKVEAQFDDGFAPRLLRDLNIPRGDKTIVALLLETDRAPFVVRNPAFGKHAGDPVEREVPWREATATRSATRSDLLQMLAPMQKLPSLEVRWGCVVASPARDNSDKLVWGFELHLYVVPRSDDRVVIAFHQCGASFQCPSTGFQIDFEKVRFSSPAGNLIQVTRTEIVIKGPGLIVLSGSKAGPDCVGDCCSEPMLSATLTPVDANHAASLNAKMDRAPAAEGQRYRWLFTCPRYDPRQSNAASCPVIG